MLDIIQKIKKLLGKFKVTPIKKTPQGTRLKWGFKITKKG